MNKSLERLKASKKVGEVEIDSGELVIHLHRYTIDQMTNCHTFGERTATEALKTLGRCVPCKCKDCGTFSIRSN